jgi:hypothetical protein
MPEGLGGMHGEMALAGGPGASHPGFGLGWMAGVIFYYPPVLFLFGVFAFLKGLATGNVSGA